MGVRGNAQCALLVLEQPQQVCVVAWALDHRRERQGFAHSELRVVEVELRDVAGCARHVEFGEGVAVVGDVAGRADGGSPAEGLHEHALAAAGGAEEQRDAAGLEHARHVLQDAVRRHRGLDACRRRYSRLHAPSHHSSRHFGWPRLGFGMNGIGNATSQGNLGDDVDEVMLTTCMT